MVDEFDCVEIETFHEPLRGSSQAFKLGATDGEIYAVKFREKAQAGALSLAREQFASVLAAALGVNVPPTRLVCLTQEYLDAEPRLAFNDGSRPAVGLGCGSRFLPPDSSLPEDHTSRLTVVSSTEIAGVLVFNTWVGCDDRSWPNYAFGITGRVSTFASIDYATAFNRAPGVEPQIHDLGDVSTAAARSWDAVEAAINRVELFPDGEVEAAAAGVSESFWSAADRAQVVSMLCGSKSQVRTVVERLKP